MATESLPIASPVDVRRSYLRPVVVRFTVGEGQTARLRVLTVADGQDASVVMDVTAETFVAQIGRGDYRLEVTPNDGATGTLDLVDVG